VTDKDYAHCDVCGRDFNPEKVLMFSSKILGESYFTWCEYCALEHDAAPGTAKEVAWLRAEMTAIRRALIVLEEKYLRSLGIEI